MRDAERGVSDETVYAVNSIVRRRRIDADRVEEDGMRQFVVGLVSGKAEMRRDARRTVDAVLVMRPVACDYCRNHGRSLLSHRRMLILEMHVCRPCVAVSLHGLFREFRHDQPVARHDIVILVVVEIDDGTGGCRDNVADVRAFGEGIVHVVFGKSRLAGINFERFRRVPRILHEIDRFAQLCEAHVVCQGAEILVLPCPIRSVVSCRYRLFQRVERLLRLARHRKHACKVVVPYRGLDLHRDSVAAGHRETAVPVRLVLLAPFLEPADLLELRIEIRHVPLRDPVRRPRPFPADRLKPVGWIGDSANVDFRGLYKRVQRGKDLGQAGRQDFAWVLHVAWGGFGIAQLDETVSQGEHEQKRRRRLAALVQLEQVGVPQVFEPALCELPFGRHAGRIYVAAVLLDRIVGDVKLLDDVIDFSQYRSRHPSAGRRPCCRRILSVRAVSPPCPPNS